MQFAIADRVKLISGGRAKTVAAIDGDKVEVVWEVNGETKREWIEAALLRKDVMHAPVVVRGSGSFWGQ
jgi:hypothetical protein